MVLDFPSDEMEATLLNKELYLEIAKFNDRSKPLTLISGRMRIMSKKLYFVNTPKLSDYSKSDNKLNSVGLSTRFYFSLLLVSSLWS